MPAGRPRFVASLLFAALGAVVSAQTFINWTGASGNFSDSTKWFGGLPSSQTIAVFSDNTGGVVTVNAAASILGIELGPTFGAYSFNGSSVLTVGSGGISNFSFAAQSIGVPLAFLPGVTPVAVNGTGGLSILGAMQAPTGATIALGGSGTASGVVSGVISGAGAVRVQSGTWLLSGTNVFTGGTTVTGGSLRLGAAGALPSGGSLVFEPSAGIATLDLAGRTTSPLGTITFRGSGGAASQIIGAGTLTLGGSVVYEAGLQPGSASISGGTLALGSASRTFLIGDSGSANTELSIGSVVSGTGGIVKQGSGTLGLANSGNLFSGAVTVNAGTLEISATGALPAGVAVTVDATGGSATLALGGTSQSLSALTLGGAGRTQGGLNTVQIGNGGVLTLGSSTAGNLTVYGSGAWPGARIGDPFSTGAGQLNFNAGGTINVVRNVPAATGVVDLEVTVGMAGSGSVQKTGNGVMLLAGSGTLLSGSLNIAQGTVLFGNSFAPAATAAGGPIVVGSGGVIGAGAASLKTAEVFLGKTVVLQSGAQLGTWDIDQGIRLNLAGPVTLQPAANSSAVSLALGGYEGSIISGTVNANAPGSSLSLVNALAGNRGLLAVRTSVGANVGSISVDGAGLILSALPANANTTLNATAGGYVGVAPAVDKGATPPVQGVVDRVGANKAAFNGTFGFDSFASASTPQVYPDNVSFASFGTGLTLGSMTSAILTGVITPPGSDYAFGNGGGILILRDGAALTNAPGGGARSLSVDSLTTMQHNALALVLQAANSFSGGVRVRNSLLLLDAAGALPAGARPISIEAGAYVGFTEAAGMMGSQGGFRGLLAPSGFTPLTVDPTAVLGLDSSQFIAAKIANADVSPSVTRIIPDRLDFSLLGPVGLGTVTRATLLGSLVGPVTGASRSLRLLGVEGGVLEVRSRLTDANAAALTVGGNSLINADGTVVLAAQNTFSGGTSLLSGTLVAAASQRVSRGTVVSGPLGLGALTVPADAFYPTLTAPAFFPVTLSNALQLGSRLSLGVFDNSPGGTLGTLRLTGTIGNLSTASGGGLDIYNDVALRGTNTFSGGVNLYNGVIEIGSSSGPAGGPLGTGTLRVSPAYGSYIVGLSAAGAQTLSNPIVMELSNSNRLSVFGTGPLTLAGPLTLNSSVDFYLSSQPLYLTGQISGPGSLGVSYGSGGTLVVNPAGGANTYAGSTPNYSGRIVFGSASAIPAGAVLAPGYDGYTGYATGFVQGASFQKDFLAKFDRLNTSGTIGLDTLINGSLAVSPAQGTPNLFSDQIDLRGFATSPKVGSASTARLSGSITPAFNTYSFGGGGGWLEVSSALVEIAPGGTNLSVSSAQSSLSASPLTVRLNSGANTFTGGGDASGAALIFAPGTMPAAGTFTVRNGGYIGSESLSDAFLGRLAIGSSSVMVGFDTAPGGTVVPITGSIDLTKLQNTSGLTGPKLLLGTASQATLSGTITLRPDDPTYRFGAYKGGQLTVSSLLTGGSVQIGDGANVALHANPINPSSISSVTLSGNNTYAGGTNLLSGLLLLGSSNALGTGTLTISKTSALTSGTPITPMLGSAVEGLSVANAVTLSGADLSLAGDKSFSMTGAISGTGGVSKTGTGTVTLTGANAFTGVSIDQGTLVLGAAPASPLGYVSFTEGSAGTVRFLDSFTVANVQSESSSARIEVAAGKTLTISPAGSPSATSGGSTYAFNPPAVFAGSFAPVVSGGTFELVFSGAVSAGAEIPQLRLNGRSSYEGATRIRPGIDLVVTDSAAFGQSSVSLEGGRLALASGVNLANALTLTSGVLAGEGTVSTQSALSVGGGVKLQPGFELAGTFNFVAPSVADLALSLMGGGGYRWKIGDATSPGGEWDRVAVTGRVSIGASAAAPFTVQLAPVGTLGLLSGGIAGFDPAQAYAWPILTASSITGFTAGAFVVDSSAFSSLAPDYKFSVGLVADSLGSSLVLNYNPAAVPEPSAWVMLLGGVSAGALWLRRRRRL